VTEILAYLSWLDAVAFVWFVAWWVGYGHYADYRKSAQRGLVGLGHAYRLGWAREMLRRENRITDASLIGNLMTSVSFFASTTILIIAGIITVLGAVDSVMRVTGDLPFVKQTSRELFEMKLVVLLGIFVGAFFKFTWSIRQFNLLSILIGSAPGNTDRTGEHERFARKAARVNGLAGDEFHRGIRAYYFGLATLTWFVQPLFYMAATALVVLVLYRQNFRSEVLRAMQEEPVPRIDDD
jgi:uncharacterized membrane protein